MADGKRESKVNKKQEALLARIKDLELQEKELKEDKIMSDSK
jgi:hypothetical protein